MDKKANCKILIFTCFCAVYFAVCFLFKYFVLDFTSKGKNFSNGLFDFYYIKNTGAAFSIFEGKVMVLCLVTGIILLGILVYFFKNINFLSRLEVNAFCFLFAGILSNFVERLSDGYVTDYFRLLFIDFPIFNLADLSINIGVILLIAALIKNKRVLRG